MSLTYDPGVPRTLRLPKVRNQRLGMLNLPHVGDSAARAAPLFEDGDLRVFESYHPSPRVKSEWASKWLAIPDNRARVMEGR